MFEGKEVNGKLGEYGEYYVDVEQTGVIKVGIEAHVNLFTELRKLAAKTDNKLDDAAIDYIEKLANSKP